MNFTMLFCLWKKKNSNAEELYYADVKQCPLKKKVDIACILTQGMMTRGC